MAVNASRKEKLEMGKSGGSPSTWEFFNVLNEFIGGFKVNRATEIMDETIGKFLSFHSILKNNLLKL